MTKRLFKWVLRWQRWHLERQIGKGFDPDLSHELDAIIFLLEK